MAPPQVGPDTVVHFSYRLFDADGELVEESDPQLPLSFLFGYAEVHPVVEQAMQGLRVGEVRRMVLPADAFGERDPSAIFEVARQELPETTEVGDEYEAEDDAAGVVSLKVIHLDEDRAVLDPNHPLAGQRAELLVAVEAVRPASSLELELAAEEVRARPGLPERLLPGSRLLQRPAPVSDPRSVVASTTKDRDPKSFGGHDEPT